jgi:enoyl-CoA hydratase/carnithine racemase
MYDRLAEVCSGVAIGGPVKVLIVTGAGEKAFAAGTDISQFRVFETAEQGLAYEHRADEIFTAIESCPVPIIAAISGACTGGGAGIAACCDLRIAARGARFGFPVARTLGNCLSMQNYSRLAALLGPARVKDIIFKARLIEAQEALEIGLVGELVADGAALMHRAEELARLVASHAPLTLQATKQALYRLRPRIPQGEGDDLVLLCYMSEDFREGMDAFLGKRKPVWKGR